jgi:hypothetical protein
MPPSPIADVHPKIYERVSDARTAFLQGFHEALRASPEGLPQLLRNEPFQSRGFALEGAAMALTLTDEFSPACRNRLGVLLNGRPTGEHVLGAIGVGWASARLGKPFDWSPTALGSHYMSAVVDGYGFHQGFFHPQRFTGRGFPVRESKLSTFYDIGLGRALWFVHIGRVEPIVHTIDRFLPYRRKPLWRGVGTACAFTGNTEYAAAQLGAAAAKFDSHFYVGLETGTQLLRNLAQQKEKTK